MRDDILFARRHARAALTSAPLRPVGRKRHALDVALQGDRHHAVLALDKVLVLNLTLDINDLGSAWRCKLRLKVVELFLDDIDDAQARSKNGKILFDILANLLELTSNLVSPERCEAGKTQLQNGFGLLFREPVGALIRHLVARVIDKLDKRGDIARRPIPFHQLLTRGGRAGRLANKLDHLVDIGDGDR